MKNAIFTLLFFSTIFPAAQAQDSLQHIALKKTMAAYMAEREFQLPRPKQDFKGLYAGTSFMLIEMPIDIVKQWSINKTCDCTGKVIRIDSVDNTQPERLNLLTIALNLEWRPLNTLSISIVGYQTRHVLNHDALVFADNNRRARLQEPLKMLQQSLQTSLKLHLSSQIYIGGGATWSHFNISKALTNTLRADVFSSGNETHTPFETTFIDENKIKNNRLTPNAFIGYTQPLLYLNWLTTAEIGIQRNSFYMAFQLLVPLTPKMWQKNRKHRAAFLRYMELHPEEFLSNGGNDGGGSDGGSSGGDSGGGSSSGGGCSNN